MEVNRLHHCWQLLRYFGPKWLTYRAYYAALMKSGLIQLRLPGTDWNVQPLSKFLIDPDLADPDRYLRFRQSLASRFFFEPQRAKEFQSSLSRWDAEESTLLFAANDISRGHVRFFSNEIVDVGFPPRWHTNPLTNDQHPSDRHWSQIDDFGAGDIKLIWELNRFSFTFALVRSYWRTGNEHCAEVFWQMVESWYASNTPERGANWKCGQEISLRVMAWCFGLYGFGASSASSPARLAMLAQMIAVSGRHIELNIGYGLSQKNNHGLSEAMGLWTIGCLFPEFADSSRWEAKGRRILESQAADLIYDDGAFSQHSMNYHRLMLHDYLWSIRLGDILDRPFSDKLRQRIGKAGNFLYQLQDESTGRVPCYGQDDGALVLPLNNCGYQDFRPVVQATHYLCTGRRQIQAGPWDEDLFWLFGVIDCGNQRDRNSAVCLDRRLQTLADQNESPPVLPPTRQDFVAPDGGYVTLRSPNGFAVARATQFRHRPSQADMLNIDVWWRGQNIVVDPGTYSYNAPPPWNNPFAHTSHHNTVTVDGLDQMTRAGRFLWLPWLNGKSFGHGAECRGDASYWNGEHDGYRRLSDPVTHRRGIVRLGADHWLIIDALHGHRSHQFRLHWLLLDAPFNVKIDQSSIELQTAAGKYGLAVASTQSNSQFDVVRAAPDSARGWRSTHYHSKEPSISISVEAESTSMVFASILGPDVCLPIIQQNRVIVQGSDWNATILLSAIDVAGVPLISSVVAEGALAESLALLPEESAWLEQETNECTSC